MQTDRKLSFIQSAHTLFATIHIESGQHRSFVRSLARSLVRVSFIFRPIRVSVWRFNCRRTIKTPHIHFIFHTYYYYCSFECACVASVPVVVRPFISSFCLFLFFFVAFFFHSRSAIASPSLTFDCVFATRALAFRSI